MRNAKIGGRTGSLLHALRMSRPVLAIVLALVLGFAGWKLIGGRGGNDGSGTLDGRSFTLSTSGGGKTQIFQFRLKLEGARPDDVRRKITLDCTADAGPFTQMMYDVKQKAWLASVMTPAPSGTHDCTLTMPQMTGQGKSKQVKAQSATVTLRYGKP